MQLFGHPFSSYTWKAQIAFYENDIPFEFRMVDPEHPDNSAELARRSAMGKFPLLVDGEASVFEATAIIEYLEALYPGRVKLIPTDPEAAVKARMMDRVFDNYVMNVMTLVVVDALRPDEHRDPHGVERAHANLDRIYAWLDVELAGRDWACGAEFTLADCAAGPSLFYADWVHPIAEQHSRLKACRGRLIARPSVALHRGRATIPSLLPTRRARPRLRDAINVQSADVAFGMPASLQHLQRRSSLHCLLS